VRPSFSASAIGDATARLDAALKAFAERRLDESYPYLILDARYERVREAGVIQRPAVLIAIGIGWVGRRHYSLRTRSRSLAGAVAALVTGCQGA
jgi:transposase-like protein